MRSIVTGVAGFIGSSLAEQLLVRGQEVVGIDCENDSYDIKLKEKNIETLSSKSRFQFIKDDLLNVDLQQILNGADHVFHLASYNGTAESWDNVEDFTRNNIFATAKLLDAAKKIHIKKFIFASSSSVYGSLSIHPFKEAFPVKPLTPYAITKLKSEELCLMYYREDKLPVEIIRYFSVYGPRQRPDMAVYKLINAALKGEEFILQGDGNQERDLIFISDAVNATIRTAEMGSTGEIYNVGSGINISISDLIKIIEEITGKKIKVIKKGPIKGDMHIAYSDISKLKESLAYTPNVDLKSGLQKQIDWMKKIA